MELKEAAILGNIIDMIDAESILNERAAARKVENDYILEMVYSKLVVSDSLVSNI